MPVKSMDYSASFIMTPWVRERISSTYEHVAKKAMICVIEWLPFTHCFLPQGFILVPKITQ